MDETAVLFANEAFYLAFSNRDFATMDDFWAQTGPVTCIHPGWPALTTRVAIINSWKSLLSNPDSPTIQPHQARVFMHSELAHVICYERLQKSVLVATNIFKQEQGRICILHHQAGYCTDPLSFDQKLAPQIH